MENKKHICKYCGKEFETGVKLGGHIVLCKLNPKSKEIAKKISQQKIKSNIYNIQCPVCGKYKQIRMTLNTFEKGKYTKTCSSECAHKLTTQNTNKIELRKKISEGMKRFAQTCTEEQYIHAFGGQRLENVICNCEYCGKEFKKSERNKSKFCSNECMKASRHKKLSNIAKKSNFGGYYENSIKKHHHGNYKGLHYDSSWELAYIIYCLDHNIEIKRCDEIRYYEINGIKKKYIPDFIVNNEIIEIKGYFNKISQIKAEQNPDIKILMKNDMKQYITYAQRTYGNNYWEILK